MRYKAGTLNAEQGGLIGDLGFTQGLPEDFQVSRISERDRAIGIIYECKFPILRFVGRSYHIKLETLRQPYCFKLPCVEPDQNLMTP